MTAPNVWTPRPAAPYQPGNTAHLSHGAYSRRSIDARAEAVRTELLEQAPWAADERFAQAIDVAAEALARSQLAHQAVLSRPNARNLEAATAASRLAWGLLGELGLTPAGAAKLRMLASAGAHAEASLADLMAEGRQVIAAREAREGSVSTVQAFDDARTDDDSAEPGGTT